MIAKYIEATRERVADQIARTLAATATEEPGGSIAAAGHAHRAISAAREGNQAEARDALAQAAMAVADDMKPLKPAGIPSHVESTSDYARALQQILNRAAGRDTTPAPEPAPNNDTQAAARAAGTDAARRAKKTAACMLQEADKPHQMGPYRAADTAASVAAAASDHAQPLPSLRKPGEARKTAENAAILAQAAEAVMLMEDKSLMG